MKGLYLRSHSEFLDIAKQNSANLSLLAKGDGADIMMQNIKKGELFFVEPSSSSEALEFFYILEGSISCEYEAKFSVLKKGDYFYTHSLAETASFKAQSDVSLLYVSTRPVFHYLSSSIDDLTKILKQVEQKDMYTYNHCKRVKSLAVKIGEKLHISRERLEALAYAALFHDIGKTIVPDHILNKPASLNDEEFELIKLHSEEGKKMVKRTYFEHIGSIIEQHHERVDGSGYPRGLKDSQILLEAKIVAVADRFDAMITERPYKEAMEAEAAFKEISSLSDIYYDRDVVNAFREVLIDKNIITK